MRKRFVRLRVVLLLVVLCWDGFGGPAVAQEQTEGENLPMELEPAPPGFANELAGIYSSAMDAAREAVRLAGNDEALEGALDSDSFAERVLALSDEQLSMIYTVAKDVDGWTTAAESYNDAAAQMSEMDGAEAAISQPSSFAARAFEPGNVIQPPEGAPEPESDLEVLEEDPVCPPRPPGPNYLNDVILALQITLAVVNAVWAALPKLLALIPLSIPDPVSIIVGALVQIAEIAPQTVEYVKNVYYFCLGENFYASQFNTDALQLDGWNLMGHVNRSINKANDDVIFLRQRLRETQLSTDELLTSEIQQALIAPIGTVANIAYQLPVSEDGYLDGDPIGVRSIVQQAIEAAQGSGLPVSSAARTYLASAESALANQDYTRAYEMYQRAYQALGS